MPTPVRQAMVGVSATTSQLVVKSRTFAEKAFSLSEVKHELVAVMVTGLVICQLASVSLFVCLFVLLGKPQQTLRPTYRECVFDFLALESVNISLIPKNGTRPTVKLPTTG